MASTINVSSLADYAKEQSDKLFVNIALGAKTIAYLTVLPTVKYKEALNNLDSTVEFDNGDACGFSAKGSDVLSQRFIEVFPLKVNKEWCAMDLRKKWANYQLMVEAGREKMPFEEKFIEANQVAIREALDKAIWQSDIERGMIGFLDLLAGEASVVKGSVSTGSTATTYINKAYELIPMKALQKGDCYIFVSPSLFKKYISELNATCCANRPIIDAEAGELMFIGDSRVKVVGVAGLEGVSAAVAGQKENMYYGTDIEGSEDSFDYWYSKDADMFRFKALFNAGVQVRLPGEIAVAATSYTVSATLNNSTSTNSATSIIEGQRYETYLAPKSGYAISAVAVTNNGTTVSDAYDSTTGRVFVEKANGNIAITVTTASA